MNSSGIILFLFVYAMEGFNADHQAIFRIKDKIPYSNSKRHENSLMDASNVIRYSPITSRLHQKRHFVLEPISILKNEIGKIERFNKPTESIHYYDHEYRKHLKTNLNAANLSSILQDHRKHKRTKPAHFLNDCKTLKNTTFFSIQKRERSKRLLDESLEVISYITEEGQKVLNKLKGEMEESNDYKVVPESRRIKLGRDIDYNLGLSKKAPILYYIESHTLDPELLNRLNRDAFCNIANRWKYLYSKDRKSIPQNPDKDFANRDQDIQESKPIRIDPKTETIGALKRSRRTSKKEVLSGGMLRALERKLLNIRLGNLRKSLFNQYHQIGPQLPDDAFYIKRNEEDEKKNMEDEDLLIRKLAKALIMELGESEESNTREPMPLAQGSDLQRGDAQPPSPAKAESSDSLAPKLSGAVQLQENSNPGAVVPKGGTGQMFVEPGLPCDYFDDETQSCWYDRQVGETLTITLRIKNDLGVYQNMEEHDYDIRWQRRFKIHNEKRVIVVNLAPDQTPWNIVLGSGGSELRFSPLTDSDMDYNSFRVEVFDPHRKPSKCMSKMTENRSRRESDTCLAEITFRINIIPVDMGPMFSGEETLINIENYISLPFDAIVFDWRFERVDSTALALPSNMKVSPSGRSLAIKELRENQHGILECAMYSSKGMFIAKRRFAIHLPKSNSDFYRGTVRKRSDEFMEIFSKKDFGNSLKHLELPPVLNFDKRNSLDKSEGPSVLNLEKSRSMLRHVHPRKDTTLSQDPTTDVPPVNASLFYANLHTEPDDEDDLADEIIEGENGDDMPNNEEEIHDFKDEEKLANDKQQFPELVEPDTSEEDFKEEYIMTKCGSKVQCSPHASCIECGRAKQGFCHCNQGFHGNGVFCWESQR